MSPVKLSPFHDFKVPYSTRGVFLIEEVQAVVRLSSLFLVTIKESNH